MARVLGKPGRYVENESVHKSQQFVLYCLIVACVCAVIVGFSLARMFNAIRVPFWFSIPFSLLTLGVIIFCYRMLDKTTDALERERIHFRQGAVGEALVGYILEGLPDDFVVLNDLKTEFGNIDHCVVGPTGVFCIDTKNWRGVVEVDGKGGLLLNGKSTTKDDVGRLVSTCAETKKKIKTLCGHEPFIRAVLVFTSAHVEAKFGSIKYADCVRDERLHDYITDSRGNARLSKGQIDSISRAFEMLAGMDKGFEPSRAAKA